MKKVKLAIVGLSFSQTQSGAYALVLGEIEGKRRLPIIIGAFEAQSIAIEIEKMTPSRPLTHDLFKNLANSFQININEILIYNLIDGVFFAKLICEKDGKIIEIDARTSDAVAIAVRFNAAIYAYEFILTSAGIIMEGNELLFLEDIDKLAAPPPDNEVAKEASTNLQQYSLSELQQELANSLSDENYEKAAKIRDEINKRNAGN